MVEIDNSAFECYGADKAYNRKELCQCHNVTSYDFRSLNQIKDDNYDNLNNLSEFRRLRSQLLFKLSKLSSNNYSNGKHQLFSLVSAEPVHIDGLRRRPLPV